MCARLHVCSHVCGRTCMWVCIRVWKPAHVTCLPQLLSTLHTEKVELISSASLANQPAPWAPRLCCPMLGFQKDYRVQTAFTLVPGIRTRVFTLAQQALSTLSRFPSPEIYNFKLLHFFIVGGSARAHLWRSKDNWQELAVFFHRVDPWRSNSSDQCG